MKRVLILLFVLIPTAVFAEDLYMCIDNKINSFSIVTTVPTNEMKDCRVIVKNNPKPTPEFESRINSCINCCNTRNKECLDYTYDGRLCLAENQNCAITCVTGGRVPSNQIYKAR